MRLASIVVLSVLIALSLGATTAVFLEHHPVVSSVDLGRDTADAKASFSTCKLYASWPVELKTGERLILERRVCPAGFHKDDEDEGWINPTSHEVLLLEKKSWWTTQILSAQFSDLAFSQVEIGKTAEGQDAVLWSYFVKCGSCHGGPVGVLAWSGRSNAYRWNEDWFEPFSKKVQDTLQEDDYADSPPMLTWENNSSELGYSNHVYRSGDAHCCATGGTVIADFIVRNGHIELEGKVQYVSGE